MKNILRHYSPKMNIEKKEQLIQKSINQVFLLTQAKRIYVVGSILSDSFDDYSDIDLVVVFSVTSSKLDGEKTLYRNSTAFERPVDFICVDESTFAEKSKFGGIYYTCLREGREFKRNI